MRGFFFAFSTRWLDLFTLISIEQNELEFDRFRVAQRVNTFVSAIHKKVQLCPLGFFSFGNREEDCVVVAPTAVHDLDGHEFLAAGVHAPSIPEGSDYVW